MKMRYLADKMRFRYVAIIGEEYKDGLIVLRDMKARSQASITLDRLIEILEESNPCRG
jgi:histidyl-tRNA synthetase